MEKLLPYNLEAEEAILGSILIDAEALAIVSAFLRPDDFYRATHTTIYAAMLDLASRHQPVDLITLTDELDRADKLEEIGGTSAVGALANNVPTSAHVVAYAERVAAAAALRRYIFAAGQIAGLAYDGLDPDEVHDQATALLAAAQRAGDSALGIATADLLDDFEADLLARYEAVDAGAPSALSTGFPALDEVLVGLEPGELVYLAGRPGMGKSAYGRTLAVNVAQALAERARRLGIAPQTVDYVTLEMSSVQQVRRMIGAHGHLNTRHLRAGFAGLHPSERVSGYRRAKDVSELYRQTIGQTLYWHEQSVSARQLRGYVQRAVARRGLRVLVLDQLDLLADEDVRGKAADEYTRVTRFSRTLKQIARQYGITILCLVQLNRSLESRTDKRPQLHDLRQSGGLEQDGDFVLALYRAAMYDKDRAEQDERFAQFAELLVLKARDGEAQVMVPLQYEAQYTRFAEWPDVWPHPHDETRRKGAASTGESTGEGDE